jgi:hypothetical protein
MPRRAVVLVAGAVIIVLALVALFVWFPAGTSSSDAAVLDRIDNMTPGAGATATVLAKKDWGKGQLVLVGYTRHADRKLGLAFVTHGPRGWRLGSYTEETAAKTDIVIGSLLVASSEGGSGQPAWSAAVGELTDTRIARVEVTWSNGQTSVGTTVDKAYLVTETGTTTAKSARYISKDGTEIAKVPINS